MDAPRPTPPNPAPPPPPSPFASDQKIQSDIRLGWTGHEPVRSAPKLLTAGTSELHGTELSLASSDQTVTGESIENPVALYRHSIEASLKAIIVLGAEVTGFRIDDRVMNQHRLGPLWIEAKRFILGVWPEGDEKDFEPLAMLVREFELKESEQANPQAHITRRVMREGEIRAAVDGAFRMLDGCVRGLREYLNLKHRA